MQTISYKGILISYSIERKKRKSMAIKINNNGDFLVSVPKSMTKKSIDVFIENNIDWIYNQKILFRDKVQKLYVSGEKILLLGKEYLIDIIVNESLKNAKVSLLKEKIIIECTCKKSNNIKNIIENWYRKIAKEIFNERTLYYANKIGIEYNKISIKNQKTRWGSCSSKKNLNFNFRLIMAPKEILDYIIIHELCHLIHFNHSKEYWETVEKYMPDYIERKTMLKDWERKIEF